ncbi:MULTISPECIES: hypothetical protein [unclassified Cupriavidus]|uniref:hypothetical protein n=1 Tax=unclassified Cupriavidus TaxID=2640874 RepID=UPI001AE8AF19|nr:MULTISPECIES: hypothetical protein [unclassified Cupriavidus]MBP0633449.1 hypothetical protein [Cupriavidus sp. AcVe19-1a]MBP0639926.1 hypothetical protein [Cupriavidus sp. AcVe19-6a]
MANIKNAVFGMLVLSALLGAAVPASAQGLQHTSIQVCQWNEELGVGSLDLLKNLEI